MQDSNLFFGLALIEHMYYNMVKENRCSIKRRLKYGAV